MARLLALPAFALALAVWSLAGCTPDAPPPPAAPTPVVAPDNALVGRYTMGVDALSLSFTIDRVEPAGENRYTLIGQASGSLPDMGGDIECTFDQTGEIDHQNVNLTFTPRANCPHAFGTAPTTVRLRLLLAGWVLGPEAYAGTETVAIPN